jgi:nicotinamidase-related amidase
MGHIWDDMLSEQDRKVIEQGGYIARGASTWDSRSLGQRPVVLVIDMMICCCGPNVPILEAMKTYRIAMGNIAWAAMEQIKSVLAVARRANIPIVYTHSIVRNQVDVEGTKIVEPLAPQAGDLLVEKSYASAFYGTALISHLIRCKADTVIVVGNSTSGCVRATCVDAQENGFSVMIPEECVFDRIQASHKVNLLDLWMKYAQVVPVAQVNAYIESLKPAGVR